MMWNLIIVDDNVDTLTGLAQVLDWDQPGVRLSGTASSGAQALELLETQTIDIVLADIRMPNIDGIELTEIVRQTYPETRVILISAYEEFQYARDAIRLGVDAYLVKPCSAEEVQSAVAALCAKLTDERGKPELTAQQEHDRLLQQTWRWNRRLEQLVVGDWNPDESDAAAQLAQLGMPGCAPPYHIMTLSVDGPPTGDIASDSTYPEGFSVLSNQILEQLAPGNLLTIFHTSSDHALAFLALNRRPDRGPEEDPFPGPRVAERLCTAIEEHVKRPFTVAVGGAAEQLIDLKRSLEESREALEHRMYLGPGRTIYFGAVKSEQAPAFHYPLELEHDIIAAVSNGVSQVAVRYVDTFAEALEPFVRYRPHEVRTAFRALLTGIGKVVDSAVAERDGTGSPSVERVFPSEHNSFEDLRADLKSLVYQFAEDIASSHSVSLKARIGEAERFIANNLASPLTLAMVARRVGFSTNYFSTLFHKITGLTFRDFVVALRIRRAKDLLRTGSLRVYEVARQVGYTDSRHFAQLFKRETGLTPHEFAAIDDDDRDRPVTGSISLVQDTSPSGRKP